MHLIKVNAIDSTNSFAREMFRENPGIPPTCIVAKKQSRGRGQRGSSWNSEPGKNLTFSIVYPAPQVSPERQFLISAAVAGAVAKALEKYKVPKLMVKWPNDIMSANKKIGGMLIENILTNGKISAVVIGLGLNVNQQVFEDLPGAGSLKNATGQEFDLEEVLKNLLKEIEPVLQKLSETCAEHILGNYKKRLFRLKIPSAFQLPDGSFFTGMITDVSPAGKLLVSTEDDGEKEYDLKEIRLCY